jgi:ribonuclease III
LPSSSLLFSSTDPRTSQQAYIGGLYEDQGLEVVNVWLNALLTPFVEEMYVLIRKEWGQDSRQAGGNSAHNTQPSTTDACLVASEVPTDDPAEVRVQGHLGLLNQWLHKNRKSVEWVWTSPYNRATAQNEDDVTFGWFARIKVDGQFVGCGHGRTKQWAKNEAAKEAIKVLGCDVRAL